MPALIGSRRAAILIKIILAVSGSWVLAANFWNDAGVWDDAASWID